jgi:hypothetical protein
MKEKSSPKGEDFSFIFVATRIQSVRDSRVKKKSNTSYSIDHWNPGTTGP